MPYFIAIQYPYEYLVITLANDQTIIAEKTITKFKAISQLIPTIQETLQEHNINLSDIASIGINTGPGPFNTLRSIIATANAIAFAQNIPLISCNGLDLILDQAPTNTIAILDAFSNDVYFAIKASGKQGYSSIEDLMNEINNVYKNQSVYFVGNGALKHQNLITQKFSDKAHIQATILFGSSQALVKKTYEKYIKKEVSCQIFPLYFASPVVKS